MACALSKSRGHKLRRALANPACHAKLNDAATTASLHDLDVQIIAQQPLRYELDRRPKKRFLRGLLGSIDGCGHGDAAHQELAIFRANTGGLRGFKAVVV
jgi:hypothetical protein